MEELCRTEVTAVVDDVIDELLAAAGVVRPPVDALKLAQQHLGITVCLDRRQPQRGRAQRHGGDRHIFLRPEPTKERHQWTIAHEIGEHFKVSLLQKLGIEVDQIHRMSGESLANLFAQRLLVPTCWFAADAAAFHHDLLLLKDCYPTASHEVIAWRLLDLGDPCVITIVDNGRVSRRRSNAWRVNRHLTPAEKQCQQDVSRHSIPRTMHGDGCSVHGWPVHKPNWKREILRAIFGE